MVNNIILTVIRFYRKHLSSKKGFRCAYGVATGKTTCSTVGLRAFSRAGVVKGWLLTQRQFDRCTVAHGKLRPAESAGTSSLQSLPENSMPATRNVASGSYRRLGPMEMQRGFVDCDGCDVGFCDSGPCDAGACEASTCNAKALSCPACTPGGPQGGFLSLLPDCNPCSDCDGSTRRPGNRADLATRANVAAQRVSRRAQKRQARRDEAQQRKAGADASGEEPRSD